MDISKLAKILKVFSMAFIGSVTVTFFVSSLLFMVYSLYPDPFISPGSMPVWGFTIMLLLLALILFGIILYKGMKQKEPLPKQKKTSYALIVFVALITGMVIVLGTNSYNNSRLTALANEIKPEVKKYEQRKFERLVLRGEAIKGNAADFYLRILKKDKDKPAFKLFDKDDVKKLVNKDEAIKPVPAIIDKYKEQIDIIRKGTQHEYSMIPLKFTLDFQFPNFIMAMNMSKIMTASAMYKFSQGKYKESLEIFFDVLRFGQDISNSGFLIGTMVGVSIDNTAISNFGKYLTAGKLSAEDYKLILSQMAQFIPSAIELKTALINEKLLQQNGFLEYLNSTDLSFSEKIGRPLFKPLVIDTVIKTGKLMRPMIDSVDSLYSGEKKKINQEDLDKIAQSNIFTAMASPNFSGSKERVKILQTIIDGLYVNCAIRAYRAIYHKYPDNLKALKPSVVSSLPLDPFSAKPFIYKLKDANYVLYSIGKNLTDDGGKEKFYYEKGEKADIVFNL